MEPELALRVMKKQVQKFLSARPGHDVRLVLVLEGDNDPVLPFLHEVYFALVPSTFFDMLSFDASKRYLTTGSSLSKFQSSS